MVVDPPTGSVLITGAPDRVAEVSSALEALGVHAVPATDADELHLAVEGHRYAGYVQLPVVITPKGDTLVARLEYFLTEGLLSRFRTAATVVPALADGAQVVLVAGHTPSDVEAPDDKAARFAMLRVLGHTVRAEKAPGQLRVRICDHRWSPSQLAAEVTGATDGAGPTDPEGAVSAQDAHLTYDDWRTEVLGMVGVEF